MTKRRILSLVLAVITLVTTLTGVGLVPTFATEASTEISSAAEFAAITDGSYKLTADIDLTAIDFTTIESFTGTLDGNGKTVTTSKPLFGTLGGEVKNLTLNGAISSEATNAVGALASAAGAALVLDGITNNVAITTATASAVGGLIGEVKGTNVLTIKNSVNEANITGSDAVIGVAGFVGNVTGAGAKEHATVNMTRCVNNGVITNPSGNSRCGAGGLIGSGDKYTIEVSESLNTGDIIAKTFSVGGIFGGSTHWERDVANSCDILKITNSANYGNITVNDGAKGGTEGVGGITGRMNRGQNMTYVFNNCYNLGNITGGTMIGGIFGYTNNSSGITLNVNNCYNIGALSNATYMYGMGCIGALTKNSVSSTQNYYVGAETQKKDQTNSRPSRTQCADTDELFTKVLALDCYLSVEGIDHPILLWQCPHNNTHSTLTAEYCDDCGIKVRDLEDISIPFAKGKITETAENAYTVATDSVSAYISYRAGKTGGERDLRFLLVIDENALKTYETFTINVTFYQNEDVTKALVLTYSDLKTLDTAMAANATYTAAEGDTLAAYYVTNVSNTTWDYVILSIGVKSDTVMSGKAINPSTQTDTHETAEEIGVMTFNLRYDTTSHDCMALSVRGPHLMEIIEKYEPDSVGFNEATNNWMNWLRGNMKNRGYAYVGVGRDTNTDKSNISGNTNEFSPVFYKADKYELLDSGTFWLSKTPAQPKTKGWGSGYNRICTYVVLKNKQTGETYAHFSTHLDHKDMEAQENSVSVIETYVRAIVNKFGNIGIVVTGDFNTVEFEPNNPAYDAFTYNAATSYLDDTRYLATELGVIGKTFMGYDPVKWEAGFETNKDKPAVDTSAAPIDFIFVKKGEYTCSYYTVVNDTFTFDLNGTTWHEHPVSDHYGVYAKITHVNPTDGFIKDDTKLTDYEATISTEKPATLTDKITSGITVSSTFGAVDGYAIDNLLKDDDSTAKITVSGSVHGYWEITLKSSSAINLGGISVTTATGNLPYNMRVLVSDDGKTWKQVGETYDEQLTNATTYYVTLAEALSAKQVRIAFVDTPTDAELVNISLYKAQ